MTQVLERPPLTDTSSKQRFYLAAVSNAPLLYWEGSTWIPAKDAAQVFPSYEAALQEKPRATKAAPVGASVVVSKF